MPIEHSIDHEQRLVMARGRGKLTAADLFDYQRTVWSQPEVSGYDELIDMTGVEEIVLPSQEKIRDLAMLSAGMDVPDSGSKMAVIAPTDLAYGLGRMYEIYRSLQPTSTKQVGVFRSLAEALAFLDMSADANDVCC